MKVIKNMLVLMVLTTALGVGATWAAMAGVF